MVLFGSLLGVSTFAGLKGPAEEVSSNSPGELNQPVVNTPVVSECTSLPTGQANVDSSDGTIFFSMFSTSAVQSAELLSDGSSSALVYQSVLTGNFRKIKITLPIGACGPIQLRVRLASGQVYCPAINYSCTGVHVSTGADSSFGTDTSPIKTPGYGSSGGCSPQLQ